LNRKLLLPTIAALPLLMTYASDTSIIIIPKPLASYLGEAALELGMFRFCTEQGKHHPENGWVEPGGVGLVGGWI
jgi:hypothetical protein